MAKRLLLSGFLLFGLAAAAGAQPAPTREAGTRNVEVDPIRCWWRTSAGAVRIGEQFDVSVTCAVLESEAVSVVVDESRLGNAVIQMAPFEVVSGSHPADMHAGIRRFFQYDYRLRIINPDAIGTDVRIPDIALHYRVNSKVDGNAAVQGRDLLYYLPPSVIRIESMVPDGTTDIRDASGASFASIDALNFRAGIFNIVGIALIAFGGLMVLLALVRLARGARRRTPAGQRQLSNAALLGVATRELAAVRREKGASGWTDDLLARALAATRVAAAGAVGAAISQRTVAADAVAGEGRLLARGPRRGTRRAVSAPTTAYDVARQLSRLSVADSGRAALESLREALTTMTAAQYGRDTARDESTLDAALDQAARAASAVRGQHLFPRSLLRRWTTSAPVESQA
ncbi:MAG TPA: hypothetical protein VM032_17485 [Vicinamibacterales bacterium]|nr:hypothetical protein [Vicinamibacterales bacterium]